MRRTRALPEPPVARGSGAVAVTVAVAVAVLTALSAAYLIAPDGWGNFVYFGTAAGGLLAFAVGPYVHRPVDIRPWRWTTAAATFFVVSQLIRLDVLAAPGLAADLCAFAGYACAAKFLVDLLRRTHTGPNSTAWLDSAAITIGAALTGWVVTVAPQLTGANSQLGPAVVNAVYPVMDALLISLTVQLGIRRGSGTPAFQALLLGMAALLSGDLAYSFVWAAHPGAVNPYVNVCYLFAYACLGLMAAHPSMRELSDVHVQHAAGQSRFRLGLFLVATLTVTSVPVVLPTNGALDSLVRAVIMSTFGGLVFARLWGSLGALQRAEASARHRVTHDDLTGLPNRIAVLDTIDAHLTQARTQHRPGWVNLFFVDCDHFKRINDLWGHDAGDDLLAQFAERLRTVPGADDLARVGGDEFVLRVDSTQPGQPAITAQQIMDLFARPLRIGYEQRALMTVSIGVTQAAYSSSTTAETLIQEADLALYQAKNAGRATTVVYDRSMRDRVLRRHILADALRGALERGEIHVVYQPIRGGAGYAELTGWEALVRWEHPSLGALSPVEFIPIAEDTGLIVDIGAFVMYEAAVQLQRWQARYGRPDLHVSVNVSAVQLLRDDVVGLVSRVLGETELAPSSLWVEITESVVLERTGEILDALNALSALGIKLCMDDFGTGYSSMSYLKDFPMNILKVDQAFVRNMVGDPRDRKLTKAMIEMAAALGMDGVVAEGVETQEQVNLLAELGCSMIQGYFYGRPARPAQAEAELADRALATAGGTP